jgi:hypothetical protein
MNGFQLYKHYVSRSEAAAWGTADWRYGQLLTSAFYLVGITPLFDMLEQAEVLGCRIGLVYSHQDNPASALPTGIELVRTDCVHGAFAHSYSHTQWLSSCTY